MTYNHRDILIFLKLLKIQCYRIEKDIHGGCPNDLRFHWSGYCNDVIFSVANVQSGESIHRTTKRSHWSGHCNGVILSVSDVQSRGLSTRTSRVAPSHHK